MSTQTACRKPFISLISQDLSSEIRIWFTRCAYYRFWVNIIPKSARSLRLWLWERNYYYIPGKGKFSVLTLFSFYWFRSRLKKRSRLILSWNSCEFCLGLRYKETDSYSDLMFVPARRVGMYSVARTRIVKPLIIVITCSYRVLIAYEYLLPMLVQYVEFYWAINDTVNNHINLTDWPLAFGKRTPNIRRRYIHNSVYDLDVYHLIWQNWLQKRQLQW